MGLSSPLGCLVLPMLLLSPASKQIHCSIAQQLDVLIEIQEIKAEQMTDTGKAANKQGWLVLESKLFSSE